MKSNVCKIENGTKDLAAILAESEKVAEYNELTPKQTLQLRLLCEEVDGMLPHILDAFDGSLWFEFEDGVCRLNVSFKLEELTVERKNELLGVAKDGKNAAATGVVGKIRAAIENFFMEEETVQPYVASSGLFRLGTGFSDGVDFSYLWSLDMYKNALKQQEKPAEWDELEKSVLASVADDIIVGIKGACVDIVVVKKFA